MPPEDTDTGADEERYTFRYDLGANQPAFTIVEAVAWITETDVHDLDPLASVVDPDALEALFGDLTGPGDFYRSSGDGSDARLQVTFEYEGCVISVGPGLISVELR